MGDPTEPKWKTARRKNIIDRGFELFSEKGVDSVFMEEAARKSGVTRMTIYRYFPTKLDLVIGIGAAKWEEYLADVRRRRSPAETEAFTAAQYFEYYLDFFIDLYMDHCQLLRFDQFFNIYVKGQNPTDAQMEPYMRTIGELADAFHGLYRRAENDGTLRTDVPENEIFSCVLHIMLAAVTRYAVGLVYVPGRGADPENELVMLKDIVLDRFIIRS